MIQLQPVGAPDQLDLARVLFCEYAQGIGVDLGFQDFEEELRGLPGAYAPPRGTLIVARDDGAALGCVAVRPLDEATAEMKRLYVRSVARGTGLGRTLARTAIQFAAGAGYHAMRLDTLAHMREALALYESLGFRPIPPYRYNPLPGAAYFELDLRQEPGAPERSRETDPQHFHMESTVSDLAPRAGGEESDWTRIGELERRVWEAIRLEDFESLASLSAPDYASVGEDGVLEWPEVLAHLKRSRLVSYEIGTMSFRRISPEVIAVAFPVEASVQSADGAKRLRAAVLSLWVLREGKWLSVLAHEIITRSIAMEDGTPDPPGDSTSRAFPPTVQE